MRRRRQAAEERTQSRFFSRDFDHYQTQARGQNFRRSRSSEWDKEGLDVENVETKKVHVPHNSSDYKGQAAMPTAFHTGTASRPAMKTLDKKISVSSDHLDTLTSDQRQEKFAQLKLGFPIRPRASYRFPTRDSELSDGDVVFKYKGENYSKNEYFFGNTARRSEPKYSSDYVSVQEQNKKTPYQMFLEDDGPYSRKLYGPLNHNKAEQDIRSSDKHFIENFVYKSKENYSQVKSL